MPNTKLDLVCSMDINWFTVTENMTYKKIWPQLKGRVFHRTSLENYCHIVAAGFIDNNQNEKYELNWQSNSFFRNRGCVSVCDFYNNTKPRLTKDATFQYKIFEQREDKDDKFVFLFLSESEYTNLVRWEKWKEEKAWEETVVPHLESGYPDKIPLSLITDVWFIKITGRIKYPEVERPFKEKIAEMQNNFLMKSRIYESYKI